MALKDSAVYKWLDNYWYHYKWRTIIFGTLGIFILVCIIQGANTVTYDSNLFYAGPYIMSEAELNSSKEALSAAIKQSGKEKLSVGITSMAIMSDEQIKEELKYYGEDAYASLYANYSYEAMLTKFYSEIYAGEAMVTFIDEGLYDLLLDRNSLYRLEDVIGYTPDGAFSEYGIRLHDTEFGNFFSVFAALPENTVICLRKPASVSDFRNKKAEKAIYDNGRALLSAVLDFEAPES